MTKPSEQPSSARALLITACASGQGKTTITAALARMLQEQGHRVRVFKTGPDFLDPLVLQSATGTEVWQLDLFMGGEPHARQLLHQAAADHDWILIEGAMGLYDGDPSSADLAERFGIPVLAVIDAQAMAQTFGAIALGLRSYRPSLPFAGVFANGVAGATHAQMLSSALPQDTPMFGWLPRNAALSLPERHLGLVPPQEQTSIAERLTRIAAQLQPGNAALHTLQPVRFDPPAAQAAPTRRLAGRRIAIARDEAFAFIYPANLACLAALGAHCVFFSPLADAQLPACDAVWLPGGYPELHAARIEANAGMRAALQAHQQAGKPLLAECGGMMSLFDSLTDLQGRPHRGFGLLPGRCWMQSRLAGLGLQQVQLPEGSVRGHSFHHSRCETPLAPIAHAVNPNFGPTTEAVWRLARTTATYMHTYFPSSPDAVASLFGA